MLYDHLPSTTILEIAVRHYKDSEIVTVLGHQRTLCFLNLSKIY